MSEDKGGNAQYLFGHSEEETRRLLLQGRLFNPYTRRLLEDAGITSGMKVLDVGSGAGDVALLAAELVGPRGTVVGAHSNPLILETARQRVRAAGLENTSFVSTDISRLALDEDFDAVVGRCVLFFLRATRRRCCAGWRAICVPEELLPFRSRAMPRFRRMPCPLPLCSSRLGSGSWKPTGGQGWTRRWA